MFRVLSVPQCLPCDAALKGRVVPGEPESQAEVIFLQGTITRHLCDTEEYIQSV